MSNFVGHRNAGIAVATLGAGGLLIAKVQSFTISYQEIGIVAFTLFAFSLFPDIDVKSTPSKIFYFVIATLLGYCYYARMHAIGNLIGFFSVLPQITKHRGIFHHPFTAVLLPALVFYLYYINITTLRLAVIIYISSVIGYFVHLIKDMK